MSKIIATVWEDAYEYRMDFSNVEDGYEEGDNFTYMTLTVAGNKEFFPNETAFEVYVMNTHYGKIVDAFESFNK